MRAARTTERGFIARPTARRGDDPKPTPVGPPHSFVAESIYYRFISGGAGFGSRGVTTGGLWRYLAFADAGLDRRVASDQAIGKNVAVQSSMAQLRH